jgi:hypothetical protein
VEDGPWAGVLDEVPDVFRSCVEESAFSDEDGTPLVTACAAGDGRRRLEGRAIDFPDGTAEGPDGSGYLFRLLVDRSPEAFRQWAQGYYEVPVDLDAVRHVFS